MLADTPFSLEVIAVVPASRGTGRNPLCSALDDRQRVISTLRLRPYRCRTRRPEVVPGPHQWSSPHTRKHCRRPNHRVQCPAHPRIICRVMTPSPYSVSSLSPRKENPSHCRRRAHPPCLPAGHGVIADRARPACRSPFPVTRIPGATGEVGSSTRIAQFYGLPNSGLDKTVMLVLRQSFRL